MFAGNTAETPRGSFSSLLCAQTTVSTDNYNEAVTEEDLEGHFLKARPLEALLQQPVVIGAAQPGAGLLAAEKVQNS